MSVAKHHEATLLELQKRAEGAVPADQRMIIVVYDGPHLLTRSASFVAPACTNDEARQIFQQLVV